MENIYAVIWQDFGTPLSLKVVDGGVAIQKAQEMHDKARFAGITLHNLHAVRLDSEDKLHTLWQPAT